MASSGIMQYLEVLHEQVGGRKVTENGIVKRMEVNGRYGRCNKVERD